MKLSETLVKAAFVFAVLALLGGCASTSTTPKDTSTKDVEPTAATATSNGSYNVVRGDHLWGIASKPRIYGNPYQWPLIYKANSDQIADADLIKPGQEFTINRSASSADTDAAVRHAKTRGAWEVGVTETSDKSYLSR